MIYVSLLLFCVVFFELFVSLRIGTDAVAIMARSQEAMQVLASAELSDDDKEVFVRRASAQIFIATLRFAAKFASIGLVLYALYSVHCRRLSQFRAAVAQEFRFPARHRRADCRDHGIRLDPESRRSAVP